MKSDVKDKFYLLIIYKNT